MFTGYKQVMNTIIAFTLALALASCIEHDIGHPAPIVPDLLFLYTECGYAPQIPQWSYQPVFNDPNHVTMETSNWDKHVLWVVDTIKWSDCMQAQIDATAK